MAEVITRPTQADIRSVVERIAARFQPRKVILFGSHTGGDVTDRSDVDLLVIMETPLSHVEQAAAIRRAVEIPFPADVLVRTPVQLAERLSLGDPFLREIVTQGIVLYEAPDARVG